MNEFMMLIFIAVTFILGVFVGSVFWRDLNEK